MIYCFWLINLREVLVKSAIHKEPILIILQQKKQKIISYLFIQKIKLIQKER